MSTDLTADDFRTRHIGPDADAIDRMLQVVGYETLDGLIDAAVPAQIRNTAPMVLPPAQSEQEVLGALRGLSERNQTRVQMIGQGYYDTVTPAVIRRRMLESPAWYTAYTPYQPEISQGRLEALLTFQTMIEDLTALPLAGASLLDEATAVVEAVLLMRRANKSNPGDVVVVDSDCFPQTLSVLRGRAEVLGIEVVVADLSDGLPKTLPAEPFGVVLQNPGSSGAVRDLAPVIAAAKERGALVTVAADLLSLTLLTPPGEQGADIAVGSAQRFGVPLFFGGPHAGYMSVRAGLERVLPGRLVGVSVDADGQPAYRLALQTREQHIRRDKATSNICTAQALLANVAAMYAAFHGPEGLRRIALRVHRHTVTLADSLRAAGFSLTHGAFFDTLEVHVPGRAAEFIARADKEGVNLRSVDADHVGISCDECTTDEVVRRVAAAFGAPVVAGDADLLPAGLLRTSPFLQHPVFNDHHSETAMLRFLRKLSDKDLALDRTMIPLGSCTMKLNSAIEMEPISFPGFASIHPYAPVEQTAGYHGLISDLERWLCEITGYDRISLQPNAGSQGELAGLLAIHAYHESRGDTDRDIVLIPQSAHGTNAASAVLAGMKVVVVAAGFVVGVDGQQSSQFALRPGVGLQGNPVIPGDLAQPPFEVADQRVVARGLLGRRIGMDGGEAGEADRLHLDRRVELHRAGAQWDHRAVEREVLVGELAQETQHRRLGVVRVEHWVLQIRRGASQPDGDRLVAGHHRRPECGRDAADHLVGSALVTGDADMVGVDQPQVDAVLVGAGDELRGPAVDTHRDGVEEIRVHDGVAGRAQGRRERGGVPVRPGCDAAQPVRAVERRVHRGHVGQQRLGGADVAGGLLAADVLLAGLQCQPVGGLSVGVHRHTHQATGQHPLQPGPHRHETGVRAAEEQRNTEALRRADRDVGALLPRRGEQGQRQQVGGDGDERSALLRLCDHRPDIAHHAAAAGILDHHAERLGGDRLRQSGGQVCDDDLDAEHLGAAAQHRDGLREAFLVDDDDVGRVGRVGAAHQQHGLDNGSGLVEQRRPGQRQSGQVLDECLERQQCLEPALGDLRLIGRVGGVPGRRLQHPAPDHGRGDGVVVALTDHLHPGLVALGEIAQRGEYLLLGLRRRQRHRFGVADGAGDGRVDQVVETFEADGAQHVRDRVGIGADVAGAEAAVVKIVGHGVPPGSRGPDDPGREWAPPRSVLVT